MADAIQVAFRGRANTSSQGTAQGNELGEQFATMGLPPYTEQARKGNGYATMSVSAVAGLVIRPTTTAALEIWNGYNAGGPSLIIDRLFFFNLVSTAAAEAFSGWAQVTASKSAPSSASLAIRGNTGKSYGGQAVNAISTTVVDSGWFPWTNNFGLVSGGVTPLGAIVANVEGRLIVPPGSSLCLHVVSSLVGQTFTQGASWYEETLTIG